jgi:hypothetical protein
MLNLFKNLEKFQTFFLTMVRFLQSLLYFFVGMTGTYSSFLLQYSQKLLNIQPCYEGNIYLVALPFNFKLCSYYQMANHAAQYKSKTGATAAQPCTCD